MGACVRTLHIDDRPGWEAAHARGGLPSQSWEHAWALAASGTAPMLAVVDEGPGRLLVPFFERTHCGTRDVATVFGLSGASMVGDGDIGALLGAWRAHALASSWVAGYLQLSALSPPPASLSPLDQVVDNGNPMYLLDLAVPDPLSRASAITRRKIRAAESGGATLVRDRDVVAEAFLGLWPESPWRTGASRVYDFSTESLRRWAFAPSTLLVGAARGGSIEAVTLCLTAGPQAEFLFNASTEAGRAWSAFLLWKAMEACRERGVRWFNLGGGVRPDDGLAQFKQRFGATARDVYSVRQVFDPETFDLLCGASGTDRTASRFPPYRFPR